MSTTFKLSGAIALAITCAASPLMAQGKSGVTTSEMDAALTSKPTVSRAAVQAYLATSQVQHAASSLGLNAKDLSARVATLDQASLNAFAQQSGVNDRILAGGSESIVISTTVIIIALLLIILLAR